MVLRVDLDHDTLKNDEIMYHVEAGTSNSTRRNSKRVSVNVESDVFSTMSFIPEDSDRFNGLWSKYKLCLVYLKVSLLVLIWLGCGVVLISKNEPEEVHFLNIPGNHTKEYLINNIPKPERFLLKVKEAALLEKPLQNIVEIWLGKNLSNSWKLPLVGIPDSKREKIFHLNRFDCPSSTNCTLRVNLKTNSKKNLPIFVSYRLNPIDLDVRVSCAAGILVFLYILIAFEIVNKILAAMLASTMSIAALTMLDSRPSMSEIASWMDTETLVLLFAMMVLVAIVSETGIFDYLAVTIFKITGGKIWPLINTLCFTTALLSCFLDNVTTALLMTPITIRLCEVMKLNPVPILTNMVIYSNIGGAITPIGDPPNIIVASNQAVIEAGVDFGTFTLHMGIGVALALVVANIQLRITYGNPSNFRFSEPPDLQKIRREMEVWKRTATSLSSYSKEEDTVKDCMIKRTSRLGKQLHSKARRRSSSAHECDVNLSNLIAQYPIKDKALLVKSIVMICLVVLMFFLNPLPMFSGLGLSWTAVMGSLLLLIISNVDDLDPIIAKVEWGTLLFFGCLFILMEALSRLNLIDWIGNQTQSIIMSIDEKSRLASAILIILWVSTFASALVDNIPLTTMMVRIVTSLAHNKELGLPLQPLIWALSFGACFGGNGTLFGSSSNIVCAGVSEKHGYKFSFLGFMRVGLPITISTVSMITAYLLIAHVVIKWN